MNQCFCVTKMEVVMEVDVGKPFSAVIFHQLLSDNLGCWQCFSLFIGLLPVMVE